MGAALTKPQQRAAPAACGVLLAGVLLRSVLLRRRASTKLDDTQERSGQDQNISVAIIGAGVSGLATAHTLVQLGFRVSILEKAERVGGQWLQAYPRVALQVSNCNYSVPAIKFERYHGETPLGEDIREYLHHVSVKLEEFGVDIRFGHEVVKATPIDGKWRVSFLNSGGELTEDFDKLVVASGLYSQGFVPDVPGAKDFAGRIFNSKELNSDAVVKLAFVPGQAVVVVGNGKSAVDLAVRAAQDGCAVHHVFRRPRTFIHTRIFGVSYLDILWGRFASIMIPCWDYPSWLERALHLTFLPRALWALVERVMALHSRRYARGLGDAAEAPVELTIPRPGDDPLPQGLQSSAAVMHPQYLPLVARGNIEPHRAELAGLAPTDAVLSTGEHLPADVVLFCVGSPPVTFPFFSAEVRQELEREEDGLQLFRHVIHPQLEPQSLAFAGWNHGFLHIVSNVLGALWVAAVWKGHLLLPDTERMLEVANHVQRWKRENVLFERVRGSCSTTRYQHYHDMMLAELRLPRFRKLPNVIAEVFFEYSADDYTGIVAEYLQAAAQRQRAGKAAMQTLGYLT